uniref:Uncharacterized protein n=1 Tax=Glossina pallidipes TaxID=7398 RepID=A0A1A9ZUE8_GLOPL
MFAVKKNITYFMIFLIVFTCCTEETEGLRRVLRGRRTLTRRYFSGLAIPGWSLVLLIGISELLLGAILYAVMYKVILTKEVESRNTYAPAPTNDI